MLITNYDKTHTYSIGNDICIQQEKFIEHLMKYKGEKYYTITTNTIPTITTDIYYGVILTTESLFYLYQYAFMNSYA